MKDPWESCITICNQWAWKPNVKIKSAYFMKGDSLSIQQDQTGILLKFPAKMPDENDSVIIFELDTNAELLPLIDN